ncbi:RNA cytosine-C(5)-methyltransferase NSUN2-like [Oppia nitens]|uniref:RNA cytosine-C(5)-methyltransferase NSUN2-like n=1 Tax=Oppia nitens TaxID=1686743 RepID=UPI0023DC8394|nr:RNA cytosine-C(5)-methyltransferase NSUN2-like [Oppia nitens]
MMSSDLQTKKKKRKQFRRQRHNKSNDSKRDEKREERQKYVDIVKDNKDYEKYYKMQNIVADEEWEAFMACLREPLPSAFRLTSYCKSQTIALRNIIESKDFNGTAVGDNNNGLECIEWYPNRFAWNCNISRVEIRKSDTFRILQNFLISETDSGYISRQEAVSMIPALLMDLKPGYRVLDMCAAPGSKTAQIIEMLHSDDGVSEGAVVANDVDNKRCYMLVHQSKRLHSCSTLITNHDAGGMPNFYEQVNGQRVVMKFDRILCDVPCSGDGTIRKNTDVWFKWNAANGNNFHGIQYRIARRGLEMLRKDGILVYSTCSLNPIEDESVIASLLNASEGGAHLVDVSQVLPKLKYSKGLDHWKVMTREVVCVESVEEVEEKYKSQIRESLFPPKNIKELNLNRCLRVLPHLQNTGGFFVAVIRKTVDTLPWESSTEESVKTPEDTTAESKTTANTGNDRPRKKRRVYGFKEDPFIFMDKNDCDWIKIKEYYGIKDTFPSEQLVYRCAVGKKKNIYFLTKAAKEIVVNNQQNIKLINGGVRLFSRSDDKVNPCGFRITQEGLQSLYPYLNNDDVIELSTSDAKQLLSNDNMPLDQFTGCDPQKLIKLSSGCCVLVIKKDVESNEDLPLILPICCWKGKTSLRAYIAKNERIHYLRLCGADVTETEVRRGNEREKHKVANYLNNKKLDDKQTEDIIDNPIVTIESDL